VIDGDWFFLGLVFSKYQYFDIIEGLSAVVLTIDHKKTNRS